MIKFELTKESANLGDRVFIIAKKMKRNSLGRLYESRTAGDYEVVEAEITDIHYGWSPITSTNRWSFAAAAVDSVDGSEYHRYIEGVSLDDCFATRKEAETALAARLHQLK